MAKIMVSEAEFNSMKRQLQQQPPPVPETREQKLDFVDRAAVARMNEERRRDLTPPDDDAMNQHYDNALEPFLPPAPWSAAMKFLTRLLNHPSVDLHQGFLYLNGRKVDHVVLVLHLLFGAEKRSLPASFTHFLRREGIMFITKKLPKKVAKKPVPKKLAKKRPKKVAKKLTKDLAKLSVAKKLPEKASLNLHMYKYLR